MLAMHPVGCDSPMQIVMPVWHTFSEFELPWSGVTATADNNGCLPHLKLKKKVCQTSITICRVLSHPTKSLKTVNTLGGLISRPVLDLGFFCPPHDKGKGYKEIHV